MTEKELKKMRKDILGEIDITKGKLTRLNEIMDNLKKEETPVIENRQDFIETCLKFVNGEIEGDRVRGDLQKFNTQVGKKTEIGMILADLEDIQKDLQRQLHEKTESVRSIEKGLWRLVFEELRIKLHDHTRNLLEKVVVGALNARMASDFNLLFANIFGKFQRFPSQEKRKSIEEEVKKEW